MYNLRTWIPSAFSQRETDQAVREVLLGSIAAEKCAGYQERLARLGFAQAGRAWCVGCEVIKTYYMLTKPGIIYGNLLTATGGFLLASKGYIDFGLFIALLAGTSLIIGSGCAFNNYTDRRIDLLMTRTKNRAVASGMIKGRNALIYGSFLGLLGAAILAVYTNRLTLSIGLAAFFAYVVLYAISKRRTVHGTLIGSLSGAAPPVAGYTAVTNSFDTAAQILFLIMVFWQMPHFYAIAMYRFDEYKAAKLPVLPVKKGIRTTKIQIMFYAIAFIASTTCLYIFGYTGTAYLIIMLLLGFIWFGMSINGFKTQNNKLWARKMFLFSLVVITLFSFMLSIEAVTHFALSG